MSSFTFPTLDRLNRSLARDLIDAYKKGDLEAVYARAAQAAPKLFPHASTRPLPQVDQELAMDLLADAYLILDRKGG